MRRKCLSSPDPKKAAIWRRHIELAAKAPSVGGYCEENGVSVALLSYWRRRLAAEMPGASTVTARRSRRKSTRSSTFVRAVINDQPMADQPTSGQRAGARVALPGGAVVEFAGSADPRWAASVIAAIGGRS